MKYSISLIATALLRASLQTCAFSRTSIIHTETSPSLLASSRDIERRHSFLKKNHDNAKARDSSTSSSSSTRLKDSSNDSIDRKIIGSLSSLTDRRTLIQKTAAAMLLANSPLITVGATSTCMFSNPSAADAVDLTLLDTQAKKFKKVPAFAIVDGKTGTPFMILRNTGTATAFFFTTLDGAKLVLEDSLRDVATKDDVSKKIWADARISAITMEFALKLAKGRPKAMAQTGTKYETVCDLKPSLQALSDGQRIDKTGLYNEKGRVPLFYMDEFETGPDQDIVAAGGDKTNRVPVFFEKKDLLEQWTKKYDPDRSGKVPVPEVKVMDLVDTFSTMVGERAMSSIDARVAKNLYPIASLETRKQAVECEKARGDVPAYKLGEMIAIAG